MFATNRKYCPNWNFLHHVSNSSLTSLFLVTSLHTFFNLIKTLSEVKCLHKLHVTFCAQLTADNAQKHNPSLPNHSEIVQTFPNNIFSRNLTQPTISSVVTSYETTNPLRLVSSSSDTEVNHVPISFCWFPIVLGRDTARIFRGPWSRIGPPGLFVTLSQLKHKKERKKETNKQSTAVLSHIQVLFFRFF